MICLRYRFSPVNTANNSVEANLYPFYGEERQAVNSLSKALHPGRNYQLRGRYITSRPKRRNSPLIPVPW